VHVFNSWGKVYLRIRFIPKHMNVLDQCYYNSIKTASPPKGESQPDPVSLVSHYSCFQHWYVSIEPSLCRKWIFFCWYWRGTGCGNCLKLDDSLYPTLEIVQLLLTLIILQLAAPSSPIFCQTTLDNSSREACFFVCI
jgi:hypothetical protein